LEEGIDISKVKTVHIGKAWIDPQADMFGIFPGTLDPRSDVGLVHA